MIDRLRICYLCDEYPDVAPVHGGIGVAVRAEAEWMAEQGAEVTVLSVGNRRGEWRIGGVRIEQVDGRGRSRVAQLRSRVHLARRIAEQPDRRAAVVVAPDFTGPLVTRPFDGGLVVRVHGAASVNAAARGQRPQPTLWCYERRLLGMADRVVGTSAASLDALTAVLRIRRGGNWCVVPNAVDPAFLVPPLPTGARPPDVLFVGKLSAIKGADLLQEIVPMVLAGEPTSRFVLIGHDVGEGDNSAWARLRDRIPPADRHRVEFRGRQDRRQVLAALSHAALLVMPSRSEAMPLVALEAFARGTPVVASDVGGLPEVVRHGVDGVLVPAGSADALAREVRYLLHDPERRARMGASARAHVDSAFTPNLVFGRLAAEYAAVAGL